MVRRLLDVYNSASAGEDGAVDWAALGPGVPSAYYQDPYVSSQKRDIAARV